MQQKYTIKINISLADGGKSAEDVIELYGAQVCGDVEQTAWNLCECSDQMQSEKFSNLELENWSVAHKRGEDIHVNSRLTVSAKDPAFINHVIEEYMDGFADWVAAAANVYYSRTGRRANLDLHPMSWDVDIK